MNKPAKIEVGQLWRDGSNPMWGTATVVKQKADDVNRFGLQWDGTAKHNGVCWWHTDSLHALTFVGYAPHIGPQQGAGPEAGKAVRYPGPHFCGLQCCTPKGCVLEQAKPAPEVAPVHVIPYPKLQPGFYGPGIGEMLRPYEKRDAVTGMPLTALEAIRSRKPPEPWVPSIDDWDLLPDA